MSKKKRVFTNDFKLQAVALAKQLGSAAEAARQLGIRSNLVYAWQAKGVVEPKNRSDETESPEQAVRRLQKENNELKQVNKILKAAAAVFSQDHLK